MKFKSIEKLFKYGSFESEKIIEFDTIEKLTEHTNNLYNNQNTECSNKYTLEVSASNGALFTIKIDL